jgi:hypothetical protein
MKTIHGRLAKLEDRYTVRTIPSLIIRVCLVHPENGATGVLVIDGDKPIQHVPPTPEEVEKVRADLERRRAARLSWNGGAN